jgi:hypothetical protein
MSSSRCTAKTLENRRCKRHGPNGLCWTHAAMVAATAAAAEEAAAIAEAASIAAAVAEAVAIEAAAEAEELRIEAELFGRRFVRMLCVPEDAEPAPTPAPAPAPLEGVDVEEYLGVSNPPVDLYDYLDYLCVPEDAVAPAVELAQFLEPAEDDMAHYAEPWLWLRRGSPVDEIDMASVAVLAEIAEAEPVLLPLAPLKLSLPQQPQQKRLPQKQKQRWSQKWQKPQKPHFRFQSFTRRAGAVPMKH